MTGGLWVLVVTCLSFPVYCDGNGHMPTPYGAFYTKQECDRELLRLARNFDVAVNGAYRFHCHPGG